jgi:hypothetical protein
LLARLPSPRPAGRPPLDPELASDLSGRTRRG